MIWILALTLSANAVKYLGFATTFSNYSSFESNSSNQSVSVVNVYCTADSLVNIIAFFTTSFSRTVVTTTSLGVLNVLTCITLIKNKKKLTISKKKEFQFAFICTLNDLLFFVFQFPLSMTEILTVVIQNILSYPSSSFEVALISFIHSITNVFSFFYLVLPFFINIFFNRIFVSLFFEMISKKVYVNSNFSTSKTKTKSTKNNTVVNG